MSTTKNKYPYGYMETSGTNLLDGNGNYIGNQFNVSEYVNSCFLDLLSATATRTYKLQMHNGLTFVDEAVLPPGEEVFVEIPSGSLLRFVVEDGVGGDELFSYAVGLRNDLDDHSSESTQYLSTSSSESSSSEGVTESTASSSSSVILGLNVSSVDIESVTDDGYFGLDGDVSDKYMAVGMPRYGKDLGDGLSISDSGAVVVYARQDSEDNQWGNPFIIEPPTLQTSMRFGHSVGCTNNYCVVSSLNENEIFIYKREGINEWYLIQTISSAENGSSVAIDEGTIAIGEHRYSSDTGRILVYTRISPDSWSLSSTLTAIDGAVGDKLGWSVDVDGDYIIAGAPYDETSGFTEAGSAYVFSRVGPSSWDFGFKIDTSNRSDLAHFGYHVSLSGNFASILANGDSQRTCYIYKRNTSFGNIWDSETIIDSADTLTIPGSSGSGIIGCVEEADALQFALVTDGSFRYYKFESGVWSQKNHDSVGFYYDDYISVRSVLSRPAVLLKYNSYLYCRRALNSELTSWAANYRVSSFLVEDASLYVVNGYPVAAMITNSGQLGYSYSTNTDATSWPSVVMISNSKSATGGVSVVERNGDSPIVFSVANSSGEIYITYNTSSGPFLSIAGWVDAAIISASAAYVTAETVNQKPTIVFINSSGNIYYLMSDSESGTSWTPGNVQLLATDANLANKKSLQLRVINGVPMVSYINEDGNISFIEAKDSVGSSWHNPAQINADLGTLIPQVKTSLMEVDGQPFIFSSDTDYVYASGTIGGARDGFNPALGDGFYHDNLYYYKKDSVGDGWSRVSDERLFQNAFGANGYRFGFNRGYIAEDEYRYADMHLILSEEQFSSDESSSTVGENTSSETSSSAKDIGEIQSLFSTDDTLAGRSMDADGDYLVVGGDERAYVFYRDPVTKVWSEETVLAAFDGVSGDGFGYSVAIDYPYILVGAPTKDSNNGAAYSFRNSGGNNWGIATKISAPRSGRQFGRSLDLCNSYNTYVCVSEYGSTAFAYVYLRIGLNTYDGGFNLGSVTPNPIDNNINESVKFVSDKRVLCGGGVLNVFDRTALNTWEYKYHLHGGSSAGSYGKVMSSNHNGKHTSVSQYNGSDVDIYANLHRHTEFIERDTVSGEQSGEQFGYSVDVDNKIHVSSAGDFNNLQYGRTESGAFYIHVRSGLNTWNLFRTVELDFPIDYDKFGDVVCANGRTLFTRAYRGQSKNRIYYIDFNEENSSSSDSSGVNESDSSSNQQSFDVLVDTMATNSTSAVDLHVVDGRPAMMFTSGAVNDVYYIRSDDETGFSWGGTKQNIYLNSTSWYSRKMIVLNGGKPMCVYPIGLTLSSEVSADAVGDSWVSSPHAVLTMDSTSYPYDLAINPSTNIPAAVCVGGGQLRYANAFDANASAPWTAGSSGSITSNFSSNASLIFTPSGVLPAASWVSTLGDLMFYRNSSNDGSGAWSQVPTGITGCGQWSSMAVIGESPGNVRIGIAYATLASTLNYIESFDDGGTWSDPEVISPSSFNTPDGPLYVDLVSHREQPAVAYAYGNSKFCCVSMRVSGGAWITYRPAENNVVSSRLSIASIDNNSLGVGMITGQNRLRYSFIDTE